MLPNNYYYRFQNEQMDSIISEDRLFDNKFIEEVKNISPLIESKEYSKMKLSRLIDSFVENSSLMVANVTAKSYLESQASMFSRTGTLKMIPEENTLKAMEKDPQCRFAAQLLNQKLVNRMVADRETTRKAIMSIQKRLIENQRMKITTPKPEK